MKSENILLDGNMRVSAMCKNFLRPPLVLYLIKTQALVADFGLLQGNNTESDELSLVGTFGYIDPEYQQTFRATTESDVYR